MDIELGRKALLQFYDAVNRHDFDALDELTRADVVDHEVPAELPAGREGVKQYLHSFLAAFPDLHFAALETVAEGSVVSCRARVTGTHRGDFLGIPATGRSVDIEIADFVRFDEEGRAAEHWGYSDNLALFEQLGLSPQTP